MNKKLKFLFAVLACASLSLPVLAQDEAPPADGQQDQPADQQAQQPPPAEAPAAPAAQPAAHKTAKKSGKKKKAVKKKKEKEVSEYKFTSDEPATTYKFDKRAEPIVKKSKKKKTAGKKGEASASGGSTVKPKLQKVKSIGEEDATAAPGAGGANPLAGMNIPGMGGK